MAGSSPFTIMTNIFSLNSANSMKTFRENSIGLMFSSPESCMVQAISVFGGTVSYHKIKNGRFF